MLLEICDMPIWTAQLAKDGLKQNYVARAIAFNEEDGPIFLLSKEIKFDLLRSSDQLNVFVRINDGYLKLYVDSG